MLSGSSDTPARICAVGGAPTGGSIEGFAKELFQHGYSKISVRRHTRSAKRIVRWAVRQGLSTHDLGEQVIESFGDHLRRCPRACTNSAEVVAGARLFISYLQGIDKPPSRYHRPAAAEPDLLKSFCAWMRERRGTCDRALYNYSIPIRELIKCIGGDPSALDAASLRQFVLRQKSRWPMGSAALQDGATYVPAVSDRRGSLPCGAAERYSGRAVLASDLASAISPA